MKISTRHVVHKEPSALYMDVRNADGSKTYSIGAFEVKGVGYFWMSNDLGEGMEIKEEDLYKILDEYFNKHFMGKPDPPTDNDPYP